MTSARLLLFALAACQPADAEVTPPVDPAVDAEVSEAPADVDGLPAALAADALLEAREGVEAAAHNLEILHGDVAAMKPEAKAEMRAAVVELIVNCPYNRASLQLPLLLEGELAPHDDPELADLKAALARHVDLLEALELDSLELPKAGDNLFEGVAAVHTRASLAAHPDPVGETRVLVDQIKPMVQAYSDETLSRLDAARAVTRPASREQWPLGNQLVGYSVELERVILVTEDEAVRTDARIWLDLLHGYMATSC